MWDPHLYCMCYSLIRAVARGLTLNLVCWTQTNAYTKMTQMWLDWGWVIMTAFITSAPHRILLSPEACTLQPLSRSTPSALRVSSGDYTEGILKRAMPNSIFCSRRLLPLPGRSAFPW